MPTERLQKILARAGIASRRAAEEIIVAGRVRVNGKVVRELGVKADPFEDRIEFDGRRIVAEGLVYLVLHKPRGVVSTLADPEGRPTVRDFLKGVDARVFPIGRLDFHTSGVLLVSNDGAFCDGLLHPRRDVPKTYAVKVSGEMTDVDLKRWEEGIELEDGRTRPAVVQRIRREPGKTWIEVTLFEGRNQQIRRMGEASGFPVMRLARTSFAGITSDSVRPGQFRPLTHDELMVMRETYGVPKKVPRGAAPPIPQVAPTRAARPAARPAGRPTGRPQGKRATGGQSTSEEGARSLTRGPATRTPSRRR